MTDQYQFHIDQYITNCPCFKYGSAQKKKKSEAKASDFFKTAVPWGFMITCELAGGSPPRRCSASNIRSRIGYRRGRPAIHARSIGHPLLKV